MKIYYNGQYLNADKGILLHPFTPLIQSASVISETILYHGELLRFNLHLKRLNQSIKYLGIKKKYSQMNLKNIILKLLKLNGVTKQKCRIRILVFPTRSIKPASIVKRQPATKEQLNYYAHHLEMIVQSVPYNEETLTPISLIAGEIYCHPLSHIKRNDYFDIYSKGLLQVSNKDILYQNTRKLFIEAGKANIFAVRFSKKNHLRFDKASLYLIDPKQRVLPGVTLQSILKFHKRWNFSIKYISGFSEKNLAKVDQLYYCNALQGIRQVSEIKGINFKRKKDNRHHLLNKNLGFL